MKIRNEAAARRDVERFRGRAEGYDRSFLQSRFFEPVHRALCRALRPSAAARVLDVGCGTGRLTLALAGQSGLAVGVDPAPEMVVKAVEKKSASSASFAVAEAEALPFPDASFEGATASFTLHHWRDPERGLREVARVLRPGSRFALAEVEAPGPLRWFLRLIRSPHAGWSRRELAALLYRFGFSRVRAMSRSPVGPVLILTAER